MSAAATPPRRIPVVVVSGFLGAGKTTLVRHLLEEAQAEGTRLAIVSNEFGDLGIDGFILGQAQATYVELSGGCVCCQLSGELLQTVQMLYERAAPDRLVVETSGAALPSETLLTFWRDPVRQWVEDDLGGVVVDAEQVLEGRDLEGTFEEQLTSADLIILNKVDLVAATDVPAIEARLRDIEPEAPIVRAVHGGVAPEILFPPAPGGRRSRRRGGDAPPHRHDAYGSREISFAAGMPAGEIAERVRRLGALRVKGFVETDEGIRLVQGVGRRVQLTEVPGAVPPSVLGRVVVIEVRGAGR